MLRGDTLPKLQSSLQTLSEMQMSYKFNDADADVFYLTLGLF